MRIYLLILVFLFPIKVFSLSQEHKNLIESANNFFNSFKTLKADFIQYNPDGSENIGKVFIEHPGKMRWQYEKPDQLLIIYNKPDIVYYDKELNELSSVPINDSLISILTTHPVNLFKDIKISNFSSKSDSFSFTAQSKNNQINLILTFSKNPCKLIMIENIDENNQITTINLLSLIIDSPSPTRGFSTIRPFIFY